MTYEAYKFFFLFSEKGERKNNGLREKKKKSNVK